MTIAGGKLMKIAAQIYGDPTQWNRIAAQNGRDDYKRKLHERTELEWFIVGSRRPECGFGRLRRDGLLDFNSVL
jgi:hypothetical protein